MSILKPAFKFALVLKQEQKSNIKDNSQIIVFADGFDVKENGTIVFYQVLQDNQKRKISVAAYSADKWENCLLFNLNNGFCAFSGNSQINDLHIYQTKNVLSDNDSASDDLDLLQNSFNEDKSKNLNHVNSNYQNQNISIPGFSNNQNNDYRELKNSIIEKEIKKYIAENSAFDQEQFILILNKAALASQIKIDEDSCFWSIANLIKKDKISLQKFLITERKNILDMHLKSILSRHWSGPDTKLTSIFKILQDRDETKEITIVDLVAWLKYNKYF